MNVPIRMLGITTSILWIFLIAFIASAGYSIRDIDFNIGEPKFTATANGVIALSLPLYLDNTGYHNLKAFNISTTVYDEHDEELTTSSTFVPLILKMHSTTILHNVTLNIGELAEHSSLFLLRDTTLKVKVAAGFDFAELMPAKLSTNLTCTWGAPFHKLLLKEPRYSVISHSNAEVLVPMSFDNHAAFDLAGAISARLYDGTGKLQAESQTPLSVRAGTNYAGKLSFLVPSNSVPQSSLAGGYVEISFSTSLFEYGPMVFTYD